MKCHTQSQCSSRVAAAADNMKQLSVSMNIRSSNLCRSHACRALCEKGLSCISFPFINQVLLSLFLIHMRAHVISKKRAS